MLRKDGEVNGLDIVTVRFGLLYNQGYFDKARIWTPPALMNGLKM